MVTQQQTAEVLALVRAQAQARQQLVDLTQAAVVAQVRGFAGWWDPAQVTLFSARVAKIVRAAQKRSAASTDAYAARVLRLLGERGARPIGPIPAESLRSVPAEVVFARLADEYRRLHVERGPAAPDALLDGPGGRLSDGQVLDRVVARSRVQVDDSVALAVQHQWRDVLDEPGLTRTSGFRRVLHPELSAGGSCGLCVAASDRRYRKGELLPIHARCKCEVLPIVGDSDPGRSLNRADLKALYAAAGGSTAGAALARTRWRVEQHGELGPRLVAGEHRFRSADEAAAASR